MAAAITPFAVIQGHRFFGTNRKPICDFLLVINSNLPPILHRFQDIGFDRSKSLYMATPLAFNPRRRSFPKTISVKLLRKGQRWLRCQLA